jgi:hypothetical protein
MSHHSYKFGWATTVFLLLMILVSIVMWPIEKFSKTKGPK